jgi:hypothetical protein
LFKELKDFVKESLLLSYSFTSSAVSFSTMSNYKSAEAKDKVTA